MLTVNNVNDVKNIIETWKKEGLTVGLVPTMGYLHEGHESLIKKARKENQRVVVSIFVNPIQFGPKEDFSTYPRDLEKDEILCKNAGCDLIFAPSALDMYCKDFCSYVTVNNLTEGLCGEKRPGHFNGVTTVVTKLFNIVTPNRAYFGQKDAQQLLVIKRMVRDLNFNIEIVPCEIIREEDGLAKSSRNTYLNTEERKAALILNKSLKKAKESIENGETNSTVVKNIISSILKTEALAKPDYIEIVSTETLKSIEEIKKDTLIAIAVYIGKTRLIDNIIL